MTLNPDTAMPLITGSPPKLQIFNLRSTSSRSTLLANFHLLDAQLTAMASPTDITSKSQFDGLLKSSKVVVADCKRHPAATLPGP